MNKLTYCILVSLCALFATPVIGQGIVINEILTSNTHTNTDEDGSYQDWVELYNAGASSVSLSGYGLTDDATLPYKWTFPAVTMASHTYLLVFCSDKNRAVAGSELHTNFKISSTGETITLTNAGGTVVNTVPATALASDISYGRNPNGTGSFMFYSAVTPGTANGTTAFSQLLPSPTMSAAGGFYTAGFNLTLSTTVSGATIIYTLDGSEPDAANIGGKTYSYKNSYRELASQTSGPLLQNSYATMNYSAPIAIANRTSQPNKLAAMSSTHEHDPDYLPTTNIFKGTVVRAKVIKAGALPSETVTQSFFVTPQGSGEFSLPVVSLSLNEDSFFDYTNGIFVAGTDFDAWRAANPTTDADWYNFDANFRRTGDASERAAHINYFVNGAEVLNQNIGIRINGGSTRAWQSKSLRLVSPEGMQYQFFADDVLSNFNRLVLRNSGNDFFNTYYRDALCQNLVKGTGLETLNYRPTVTFVNGEYWGLLNMRERYDKYYFKNVYNIPFGELDLLEDDLTPAEGDNDHYQAMEEFLLGNSLSVQANYDYIATQLDPENFRDYYISNIFLENVDWPGWNTEFWRKKTAAYVPGALYGHDGRWRCAMKDMDSCFGLTLDVNDHNTLEFATEPNGPEYPNPPSSTLILRSLLANNNFKTDFINRFADLMNTYFLPSRVIAMSTAMKNTIQPEMAEMIARWSNVEYSWWEASVELMHTFANERPGYQRQHIRGKFGIANDINVTLNVSGEEQGYIKINTIEIVPTTPGVPAVAYPWTGIYFSNIPIKLKAIAKDGYVFSHWTGASTSTNAEITLSSASALSATAVFVPETVAGSEPIYFWMMDGTMANNVPLETLTTTFKAGTTDGVIQYQSCLAGYPFTSTSPLWRKASMERRNSPTTINYIPEANNNVPFATSDMKGLQIKEPLESAGLGNTMVFNFSTTGYKDIKFSFAAINELTNATGIAVDYSINSGAPVWITTGLSATTLPLTSTFQPYEVDFTPVTSANNNANLKVRLRFTGSNMTVDAGNRVTFNNIAVKGTEQLGVGEHDSVKFLVYPNPVSDVVNIAGIGSTASFSIFTLDGRLIENGTADPAGRINLHRLASGMYLLQIESDGKTETKKILKK